MKKKLLIIPIIILITMVIMLPLFKNEVTAASDIVINGVDIGYDSGDYFTKNGGSCANSYWKNGKCHDNNICVDSTHAQCNCMRYWPTGNKSTCQVDLLSSQCMAFARYCQWKVYGSFATTGSSANYSDITGKITSGNCTSSNIKSKLYGCTPATHIRTGAGHSLSIIGTTDTSITVAEANYDGYCRIRTKTHTWSEFASYLSNRSGVAYTYARNGVSSAPAAPSSSSNETIIYNFLINEVGLNTAAACGVLANIEKESGFKNDVLEYGYTWETGGGYGICQWTNSPRTSSTGRRTNLVNWCNNNGYDYKSLTGQLNYLKYELNTSYYYKHVTSKLLAVANSAQGAYDAGYIWCYYFEVPAGYNTGVSVTRGNSAKNNYWPKYSGIVPPASCDCSESYAGQYICSTSETALNIRSGHGSNYAKVGSIPKGATVTVTKANGTWAHVTYNGVSGYVSMQYLTPTKWWSAYSPVDLGTDFTAVILNTNAWKPIENCYWEGDKPQVKIADESNTAHQVWYFQRQSDGSYLISSCYDGNYLDVRDASHELCTPIQTCGFTGSDAQYWFIYQFGSGYVLRSRLNDYVLDLTNGDTTSGNGIQMYEFNQTAAQIWSVYKGEECTLRGSTLSVNVGNSASPTTFTWTSNYGVKGYNIKIFTGEIWVSAELGSANNVSSGYSVILPAGTYQAYVDSYNHYKSAMGNVVTFTVGEPTTPPTNVELTKNQQWYDIGDTITLNVSANAATSYWISITKDGNTVVNQAINGTLSISASELGYGDFHAWVTAVNATGGTDSNHIDFSVVGIPGYSNIYTDKSFYLFDDTISITVDTIVAKGQVIGIDKVGYGRVITQDCGSTFTISAKELGVGKYSVYFSVYNASGTIDTRRVEFDIYDESAATTVELKINANSIFMGEDITFTFSGNNNATYSDGVIDMAILRNGELYEAISGISELTITKTFTEPGSYKAFITAYDNNGGLADSEWVYWEVIRPDTGLIQDVDGYRFYINGVAQYGWVDTDADGSWDSYFFTTTQLRCEEDRQLFDGIGARRFFLYDEETGHMVRANGFYTDEKGTQYFIDGLGAYGWITSDGVCITDRPGITLSDVHYFAYGDGLNFYMVEDETKMIGGVLREFDENHLVKSYTGWATNKTTGNANYYVDGVMQQGWCETPDGWVYLSRSENLANNITYGDVFYGWRKIGGKVYYFRASTSTPAYVIISDSSRQLTYDGVRSTYYTNQTPANGTTLVGSDYYITNPPAGF